MKISNMLAFLLVICALSSCARFSEPLVPFDQSVEDTRLNGIWHAQNNDEEVLIHVFGTGSGSHRVFYLGHDRERGFSDVIRGDLFPITSNGKQYATFRSHRLECQTAENSSAAEFHPEAILLVVRYELDAQGLSVWLPKTDALEKAVTKKKLKGFLQRDECIKRRAENKDGNSNSCAYGDVVITASGEELLEFLQTRQGRELFADKPAKFHLMVAK